ncbi:hypothetical protein [Microtetraspora malaysiensis]|uniref:hypothetical protein n=1 Tax=Microtetraspora malaysiensis TaxID=161358 RepID=UPI0034E20127
MVSAGILRALTADERRVPLAHERAHLGDRHRGRRPAGTGSVSAHRHSVHERDPPTLGVRQLKKVPRAAPAVRHARGAYVARPRRWVRRAPSRTSR